MSDSISNKTSAKEIREPHKLSLYEKLQENKIASQTEFYEESKSELSGRNLTDEDSKFLISVEESKRLQELSIKRQTDAALHEFRIKHELVSRENLIKLSGYSKPEPIQSSTQQFPVTDSSIKSKRNMLGITPKKTQ